MGMTETEVFFGAKFKFSFEKIIKHEVIKYYEHIKYTKTK